MSSVPGEVAGARPFVYKRRVDLHEKDHQQARIRHGDRYPGEKYKVGDFGDPAGYEETLYQTPAGLYFLYFRGGPESPYAQESIKCLAKSKVDAWIEAH